MNQPLTDAELDDLDRQLSCKGPVPPPWQTRRLVRDLRSCRARERRWRDALVQALSVDDRESLALIARDIVTGQGDPIEDAALLPEAD